MLYEIVSDYILKGNTLITAPTGNGSTALTLYLTNLIMVKNDLKILYYNSTADINSDFINPLNTQLYSDILFHQGSLQTLIRFLEYIKFAIDILVLDPGDTLMVDKKILPLISKLFKGKILATSQIRQDPTKNGHVYSPLEQMDIFDYSIWIRNVTEGEQLFKSRYLDVFLNPRHGNNYIRRYIAKFNTKTGSIME
jgi:hypothetical protein